MKEGLLQDGRIYSSKMGLLYEGNIYFMKEGLLHERGIDFMKEELLHERGISPCRGIYFMKVRLIQELRITPRKWYLHYEGEITTLWSDSSNEGAIYSMKEGLPDYFMKKGILHEGITPWRRDVLHEEMR